MIIEFNILSELSLNRYGVDLAAHWPRRAACLAARRREARLMKAEALRWHREWLLISWFRQYAAQLKAPY